MATAPVPLPGTAPEPATGASAPAARSAFGGSGGGRGYGEPRIPSVKLAVVILLGALTMLFTGLIGAFLILRLSAPIWPPQGLPQLPLAVTWANTAVLAASAWTLRRALSAIRAGDVRGMTRALAVTLFLGGSFLMVQGGEWVRLVNHGLSLQSGVYGSTFFTLIGVHGVHVLAAVVWLLVVLIMAVRGRISPGNFLAVEVSAIYWTFVCAVWAVLFPLVYLL